MNKVTVRIPATTANLGPGFDCMGLALSLYNTFTYERGVAEDEISGCAEEYRNPQNLAYVAYCKTLEAMGEKMEKIHISMNFEVPVSRGLGSSATFLTAGAMAANLLHGSPLSDQEIFAVTTGLEGHPDNVAPALFGGLTCSVMLGDKPVCMGYPIDKGLRFVVLIPDFELQTSHARSVLPRLVPFGDAVHNISRAAILSRALEKGEDALFADLLDDRLHQPYRRALIPGYDEAEKAARELGALGFCLSGAGPTLLCLTRDEKFAGKMRERLLAAKLSGWQIRDLAPDTKGAAVL